MLSYVVDAAVVAGVPSAVPACHGGEQQACAAPPQEVPAHPKVRALRGVARGLVPFRDPPRGGYPL